MGISGGRWCFMPGDSLLTPLVVPEPSITHILGGCKSCQPFLSTLPTITTIHAQGLIDSRQESDGKALVQPNILSQPGCNRENPLG